MRKKTQFSFKRYEKKYVLDMSQYEALRERLDEYTSEDEYGLSTICNIYYDTDEYALIRESIEKPIYKAKLRVRSYGIPEDDSKVFVELKKKFNGVVYKRRTAMSNRAAREYLSAKVYPEEDGQILHEIDWFMRTYKLKPKIFLAYERAATFGNEDPNLRITFDRNIRWRDSQLDLACGDGGALVLPEDSILMEIKIPGTTPIWLSHMLSELGIFSTSFSKYGNCYKQNLIQSFLTKGEQDCA